jgi:hypothetical protein
MKAECRRQVVTGMPKLDAGVAALEPANPDAALLLLAVPL